jgi:hypothetical protein
MPVRPLSQMELAHAERAAMLAAEQLTHAESVVESRLPGLDAKTKAAATVAVAQMIATNHLMFMTARNVPK